MSSVPRKREVSCLGLTFYYDYLAKHGIPRRRLQEGLPYPPEHLDNRLNWIDFETMCEVERRVNTMFPDDPRVQVNVGRSLGATGGFGFIKVVLRSVTSPFGTYNQIPLMVNKFLFPFCHPSFERIGRSTMTAIYRFDEGYPATDAFLQTVQGILMAVPTLMGAPEATVTLERLSPYEARYRIQLHEWLGPVETLKGAARSVLGIARMRIRNLPDAAAELSEANRLLLEKVEALTEAQTQLSGRVRDLSILNTLASSAASELDVSRLLASAAEVISAQLGDAPTALFMRVGEAPAWSAAAAARVEAAELARLTEGVRAWLPIGDEAGEAMRPATPTVMAGWSVQPMRSKDRVVGVLALATTGPGDATLLAAIADELAVAVDNAVSYRVIRDLRDNLELRVRERTAELEQARGQLEHTVVRLEQSDRARREFFTNVSHELKTPLTLILAPLDELDEALRARGLDEALPTLETIRSNANGLLRLVNEILGFARLDEGRIPVHPERFDVGRFAEDVTAYLKPLAERRGVVVEFRRPPRRVEASLDPKLVRRALVNLVVNAIKYVDPGDRVTVRVRSVRDRVAIEVEDTGPGIPEAERERIFQRFQRVSDARGRVVEGSGVGLAMVKDIAELHGGRVELNSEVGHGSTFRLVLPRASAAAEARPSEGGKAAADLSDLVLDDVHSPVPVASSPAAARTREPAGRVLLVEDNDQMQSFLAGVLSQRYVVLTAVDGVEGLEIAGRELPDAILSDVMMPRMDGFEMCRRLKDAAATRNIPLILLTARHGTEAVLEGFHAGADDFLVKPFSTPELLARVSAQLRIRSLTISLLRSEQAAALGIASAGIAHEVLNPVNAIVNSVPPLRKVIGRMKQGREHEHDAVVCEALLHAVEQSGERIHRIVDAFRTLARPPEERLDLQEARIGETLDAVLAMLEFRLMDGGRLHVHRRHAWDEPLLCHPALLGQVVMNLVSNALDAIEPVGGNVWISVDRVGTDVRISVRDDGPGIPPDIRERVFAPFFTTKPPGSGTGLGLSISREIMAMHGGTLELAPGDAGGVEFVATLPLRTAISPAGVPAQGGAG